MNYLAAVIVMAIIVLTVAFAFWGVPMVVREKPAGAATALNKEGRKPQSHALWYGRPASATAHQSAPRRAQSKSTGYSAPLGTASGVYQNEPGLCGWPATRDYEGSSASAVLAYVQRSA